MSMKSPGHNVESDQARFSRRNYPKNCWWVVAVAEEVTRNPICRWLLEQRVVLFRTEQGVVVALEDRCAHRWAPLSQGKLVGDEIACPYHGFRYNSAGICTHVPTEVSVSRWLQVKAYPVRVHGGFVWVWMGNPELADPVLLPSIPWSSDPAYLELRGYFGEVRCNYMLIQENVLDLSHVAYLHVDTLGNWLVPHADVTTTDRTVTFVYIEPEAVITPVSAVQMNIEASRKVKRTVWGTFVSPACHINGFEIEDLSSEKGPRPRCSFRGLHLTTPISPNRSHYWWAQAQDYGRDAIDTQNHYRTSVEPVLRQDATILEAMQVTIEQHAPSVNAREVLVRADRAAIEARRILERMLKAESS